MSGYVYFIQAKESRAVKIGWTKEQLRGRLSACQTGSHEELELVAYFSGSMQDEKRMHDYFASDRLRGEWFRWSDDLATMIAACREAHHLKYEHLVGLTPSDTVISVFENLKRSLSSKEAANDTTRETGER